MLTVVAAGRLSSIQDGGRQGMRHLGVGRSGALDPLALAVGNLLVGNAPDAAGLELTLGPVALRFDRAVRFALTGADWDARLDGEPVHAWWAYTAQPGQALVLRAPRAGMRAYLSVAGGIDVPVKLGSRSVDFAAGFGGFHGRALNDGDALPLGAPGDQAGVGLERPPIGVKSPALCRSLAPRGGAARDDVLTVRVLPGAEFEQFSCATRDDFWQQRWQITPNSNRMGYRLQGRGLQRERDDDLLSHAVLPGTIQVPPDGQPIILMRDAQTTGGYPRAGAVIGADLWRLSQARLNTTLRFVEVDAAEARHALQAVGDYLRQVADALGEAMR
ncbi:5-oxoprolinase subunit C family protein [Chitinasiproducens palmae]|uniref:Biotin-dependent carboxylase uncharacterized domain-containing protein n=1 Tax=Chitinasiproducens palmae TaxID=1770053 RepID=A0A1H2PIZ2_9BURK|nr:biotin-dependent carboxyltransferase family protein [Chitinasiproducens palmae]SDV46231.1 biotin-dependent carboxylase uncharacterized domain-containing protein [Chitinasiproducens palmae]